VSKSMQQYILDSEAEWFHSEDDYQFFTAYFWAPKIFYS